MRIRILDPGYKRFFKIFQFIFLPLFDIFVLKDEPIRDKDIFDYLSFFQQFRFGLKAKDFCLQFLIGILHLGVDPHILANFNVSCFCFLMFSIIWFRFIFICKCCRLNLFFSRNEIVTDITFKIINFASSIYRGGKRNFVGLIFLSDS